MLAVVALCGAGLGATVAFAGGDGSAGDAPGAGIAQVDAIERPARDALAVLGAQRGAGDAMPGELAQRIGDDHLYGVNPSLSRMALGSISNALYVLPGRGYVCASLTVADGASLQCTETAELAAGRAAPSTITLVDENIGIYGLVPDGVEAVEVETGAAGASRAEVSRNGYFAVVPKGTPLDSVSYEGPSGRVEYPIHDPASGADDQE